MLILHGTFDTQQKRFLIWAEQDHPSDRKKGRQPKIAMHPFSTLAPELSAHLLQIAPHIHVQPDTATIWLPSADKSPQPSVDLAATGAFAPPEQSALTLVAWHVDMIVLSVADAVDLLLAFPENALTSADMRYWRTLTLYALSMVAGQQVIPALEKTGDRLSALWKP